jgi:hypothetical protein
MKRDNTDKHNRPTPVIIIGQALHFYNHYNLWALRETWAAYETLKPF